MWLFMGWFSVDLCCFATLKNIKNGGKTTNEMIIMYRLSATHLDRDKCV